MLKVTWNQVLGWRLRRQFADPLGDVSVGEVVGRLAGVQAQVVSAAEMAVGLRQRNSGPGGVRCSSRWRGRGALVYGPSQGSTITFTGPAAVVPGWQGLPEPAEAARVAQVCGLDPLTVRIG